ncbi:MAG: LysM peptidoglycan-binding domain-containing protein [Acetatifactor sp.]|nr:LysM peptidoglycan-binding domain-containing protein [Acetatifactor sp.]
MAIGYLQIQARTAQNAIPVEGAQVRILDDQGNSLYQLLTDESGETRTVSLETVDRSFSLDPNYPANPYIGYGVTVDAAGFQPVSVTGIPIYDGQTATLPVTLVPLQERQTRQAAENISIGPPAVAMAGGRDQQGTSENARVLRQVVIPNPITVHLGPPGSFASNVQVPFLDYVKNVASCEIYPTWPDAALKANIYAIMTFALNRVYTEWYRSRDYNFDITNNTAYDQYYVLGHPIYDSISRAVDELFGEYVRRQGQSAPYFTSFCNGTTATCQGLSQWGTVSLADLGYSPLQILRSFYPDDIEIAETNIVANVVSSYPGSPLRLGSTGLDVQTIQTYLNRIRRNFPIIPAITDPAGTFGASTQAAVTQFQSIFNLAADGIVGKATWNALSYIYTAVTRLAELDSEGTSLGIGTVPPSATLRQGSQGQDVITLQYLLNVISQYYSDVPAPTQDGIFGSGTRQSVIAFQRAMQLDPDGIVGARTWQALYDTYLGINENVPMPGPDTGSITYTVQAGDSLWLIAQRYGTTVDAIIQANNLTSNVLQIGQVLRIPVSQSPYVEYTVRAGDTLWDLSRRYGTTVEAIMQANGLTSTVLQIGQVLRIPVG